MVSAFIFFLHFVMLVYAFMVYKKESVGEAFLAIAFVGIVFAVSWTIASMLTNLLFTLKWFVQWYWQPLDSWIWRVVRKEISRDTISLLILTSGEVVFYYLFFLTKPKGPSTKGDSSFDRTTST
jgi:hypothetical protein